MEPVNPEEYTNTEYGLIAPDGNLYEVPDYGDHGATMRQLIRNGLLTENRRLEYSGCVHISGFDCDHARDNSYSGANRVTQKQFDTMVSYMAAVADRNDYQDPFPFAKLEIIDAQPQPKTRATRKTANNPFRQVAIA